MQRVDASCVLPWLLYKRTKADDTSIDRFEFDAHLCWRTAVTPQEAVWGVDPTSLSNGVVADGCDVEVCCVAFRVFRGCCRLMGICMHARFFDAAKLACVVAATASVVPLSCAEAQTAWPAPKVRVAPGSAAQLAPGAPEPAARSTQVEKPADHTHHDPISQARTEVPAKSETQAKSGVWPRLIERLSPPSPTVTTWSDAEIKAAQNACVASLKDLDIVAVGAPPTREGECGAPAPIELVSVGKSPQVTFSPPVTVTCDMAAGLHKWVVGDLQPLAKKHLGSPIIRIETMSSYSCRTAYGRAKNKLSEHGKANAIDIRAFMTAKASTADVLAGWGPTIRDVEAQVAAARAAATKAEAVARAQRPADAPNVAATTSAGKATGSVSPASTPPAAAVADSGLRRPGISVGPQGGPAIEFPGSGASAIGLSTGMPQPNRLGGPKPAEPQLRGTKTVEVPGTHHGDGQSHFLRGAHASACRIFGTVLGPEANNAHRNHFHVDMAKRVTSSFCE